MEKTFSRGRRRLKKVGRESMYHIYIYITMLYIIRVRRVIRETPVQVQSPKSLWHRLSSSRVGGGGGCRRRRRRRWSLNGLNRVRQRIYTILYYIIIDDNTN